MQTLKQNKVLLRSLEVLAFILIVCICEIFEPLNQLLQLAPLPEGELPKILDESEIPTAIIGLLKIIGYKATLFLIISFDSACAFLVEKQIIKFFG